ncbi:MAG: sulfur oxidation c-type cytochrome SoxX [Burkholderiales bacterium]
MSGIAMASWWLAAGLGVSVAGASTLQVVGDSAPARLAAAGDPARGRALVVARESANCVLCHAVPDPAVRFSGNVGPSLAGVGSRLSEGQLRLRVADNLRVNPDTVMPSYYKVEGLDRVARAYAGKPVLSAQEVEDIVAWLGTLR